jgi:hypothetical protein
LNELYQEDEVNFDTFGKTKIENLRNELIDTSKNIIIEAE